VQATCVPAHGYPASTGRNGEPRAEYILIDKGKELGLVIGALATWGSQHVYPDAALEAIRKVWIALTYGSHGYDPILMEVPPMTTPTRKPYLTDLTDDQ
jgi:hypothetical protein